ncbi:unnamed protein product, partial [marine sediment metagenome]
YIVIAKTSVGNASEEWNGTAEMTLTTPAAEFKWIDDDGTCFTDDDTDGVIPSIPVITEVPLAIRFQRFPVVPFGVIFIMLISIVTL